MHVKYFWGYSEENKLLSNIIEKIFLFGSEDGLWIISNPLGKQYEIILSSIVSLLLSNSGNLHKIEGFIVLFIFSK